MGAVTFRAWLVGPINNRNFRTLKWRGWGDISDIYIYISPLHTQTLHMPEMGWWRKQKNGCTYPTWRLIDFLGTAWWDLGPLVARFIDDPFPKIRWDPDNTTQPGNLATWQPEFRETIDDFILWRNFELLKVHGWTVDPTLGCQRCSENFQWTCQRLSVGTSRQQHGSKMWVVWFSVKVATCIYI